MQAELMAIDFTAATGQKSAAMKLYLMTDMEGCAGILNHDDWVLPTGRFYDAGREILTEETNAAIEGFLAGGATEILVNDGHGAGGIDPLRLHPAAQLLRGAPQPRWPWLLDQTFTGVAWVGQHAKAGTDFSHITHTGWFDVIDLSVNGLSIGEYGQLALCAMELGVPVIFAAGEQALCEEAAALTPGVVTVAVKRGLLRDGLDHLTEKEYRAAKLAAVHLSPIEARQRIRAGAQAAIEKLRHSPAAFKHPVMSPPYVSCARLRGGVAEEIAEHPASLIALFNQP